MWSFSLRAPVYDDSDDEHEQPSTRGASSTPPDLSQGDESHVICKPTTPWTIARVNAALRPSQTSTAAHTLADAPSAKRRILHGGVLDLIRSQAQASSTTKARGLKPVAYRSLRRKENAKLLSTTNAPPTFSTHTSYSSPDSLPKLPTRSGPDRLPDSESSLGQRQSPLLTTSLARLSDSTIEDPNAWAADSQSVSTIVLPEALLSNRLQQRKFDRLYGSPHFDPAISLSRSVLTETEVYSLAEIRTLSSSPDISSPSVSTNLASHSASLPRDCFLPLLSVRSVSASSSDLAYQYACSEFPANGSASIDEKSRRDDSMLANNSLLYPLLLYTLANASTGSRHLSSLLSSPCVPAKRKNASPVPQATHSAYNHAIFETDPDATWSTNFQIRSTPKHVEKCSRSARKLATPRYLGNLVPPGRAPTTQPRVVLYRPPPRSQAVTERIQKQRQTARTDAISLRKYSDNL